MVYSEKLKADTQIFKEIRVIPVNDQFVLSPPFPSIIEGEHLLAQITGQPKFEIFPYEEDKFYYKIAYAQIRFNIENGKIISLTLFQNGEIEAKKIE